MKKTLVSFLASLLVSCLAVLALLIGSTPAFATPRDTLHDAYRHFIMPTAKPIQGGYAGFWELAFLQGGFGIEDVLSISGGFTVMPTVSVHSQFGFAQAKFTMYDDPNFSLGAGVNYLLLTTQNQMLHLFGVATIETPSHTRFTGLLLYKLSGPDQPVVNVVPYGSFAFSYGGALGAGLGMDFPLPNNPTIHVIGEAWNHDLTSPNKLALLGALRVESDQFSSDFGFMYFTLPLIAPVANFVWRF